MWLAISENETENLDDEAINTLLDQLKPKKEGNFHMLIYSNFSDIFHSMSHSQMRSC